MNENGMDAPAPRRANERVPQEIQRNLPSEALVQLLVLTYLALLVIVVCKAYYDHVLVAHVQALRFHDCIEHAKLLRYSESTVAAVRCWGERKLGMI